MFTRIIKSDKEPRSEHKIAKIELTFHDITLQFTELIKFSLVLEIHFFLKFQRFIGLILTTWLDHDLSR